MVILRIIEERQSSRVAFDPARKIPEEHLKRLLQAARWAPTAHNMQNFEIVVVDDRELLETLSLIPVDTSRVFIEENYDQLSFSEEELKRKKVGLLGTMFPPSWRSRDVQQQDIAQDHEHSILGAPIKMSAALLVVLFDWRKRAPGSEGDVLGMMSLGCVMENMWLLAQSLGIGFQVQSSFSESRVAWEVRRTLGVPDHLKIGFAVRLGYPKGPATYLRVRRDVDAFTHRNRFGQSFEVKPTSGPPVPAAAPR